MFEPVILIAKNLVFSVVVMQDLVAGNTKTGEDFWSASAIDSAVAFIKYCTSADCVIA